MNREITLYKYLEGGIAGQFIVKGNPTWIYYEHLPSNVRTAPIYTRVTFQLPKWMDL